MAEKSILFQILFQYSNHIFLHIIISKISAFRNIKFSKYRQKILRFTLAGKVYHFRKTAYIFEYVEEEGKNADTT